MVGQFFDKMVQLQRALSAAVVPAKPHFFEAPESIETLKGYTMVTWVVRLYPRDRNGSTVTVCFCCKFDTEEEVFSGGARLPDLKVWKTRSLIAIRHHTFPHKTEWWPNKQQVWIACQAFLGRKLNEDPKLTINDKNKFFLSHDVQRPTTAHLWKRKKVTEVVWEFFPLFFQGWNASILHVAQRIWKALQWRIWLLLLLASG